MSSASIYLIYLKRCEGVGSEWEGPPTQSVGVLGILLEGLWELTMLGCKDWMTLCKGHPPSRWGTSQQL